MQARGEDKCPSCGCQMFRIYDIELSVERWKCNNCTRKKKFGTNQFVVTTPYADDEYIPLPAANPTDHAPGTPERVREYAMRVDRGEAVFHADDRVDFKGTYQIPLRRTMTKPSGRNQKETHNLKVISTQGFRSARA